MPEQDTLIQALVSRDLAGNRQEAEQLLAALRENGFTLQPLDHHDNTLDQTEYLAQKSRLQGAGAWSLQRLRHFFEQRNRVLWKKYPELYNLCARAALEKGEPLTAYDIFATGIETMGGPGLRLEKLDPRDRETAIALVRGQAFALVRSGAPATAESLLRQLVDQGVHDSETMGLLGRIYKDLALADSEKKKTCLARARAIYHNAYERARQENDLYGAYYNGINAATLAFLDNDRIEAENTARQVEQICSTVIEREKEQGSHSFWLDATLGEAALLQGDLDRAETCYEKACRAARHDSGALATIVRQARLILSHSDIPTNVRRAPSCVLPSVIVFSGHMIDTPGRIQARFPCGLEDEIREKIKLEIRRLHGGIGFAAAAAGSDILFLESMLELGGKIHLVLPVEIEHFKKQSVDPAGRDWGERFDRLLDQAESLTILDTYNPRNFENSLEFTNRYLFGMARIRAEQMETTLRPLAVLQDNDQGGRGGTASMVRLWQGQRVEYSLIRLQAGKEQSPQPQPRAISLAPVSCACFDKARHHTSLPMLFADVQGYSRLSEDEAVCFSGSFLERVAGILNSHRRGILSRRTAGDGLFLVFHDLDSAIQVARDLQHMINSHNWQLDSLPENLRMRISLDAGPCYSYIDPVMDKLEFCGNYVVRAARMEPITPPGHIYASDTFVALCRAGGLARDAFSYAGQVVLAKNYGTLAVYHVTL